MIQNGMNKINLLHNTCTLKLYKLIRFDHSLFFDKVWLFPQIINPNLALVNETFNLLSSFTKPIDPSKKDLTQERKI